MYVGRIPIFENGEIGFTAFTVGSRHGNVSGYPPQLEDRSARVAAGNDVPIAIPENGEICFAISIEVARYATRALKCLNQVYPTMAHIGTDGHPMSHAGGGPCLVA